LNKKNEYLPG